MRLFRTLLVLSSLVLSPVLAELKFTVEATQDGKPIPASEIKLEPFEPGSIGRTNRNSSQAPPARRSNRLTRRANTVAYSSNWCGPVKHTSASPSTSQVALVHGEFVHPACTKRSGASYPQAAAVWVGIDGDAYTSALFQAGTVCKVRRDYYALIGIIKADMKLVYSSTLPLAQLCMLPSASLPSFHWTAKLTDPQ